MANLSMPAGFHAIRRDRLPLETVMDSYKARGKLSEPTVCPECGAVFRSGRWRPILEANARKGLYRPQRLAR